MKRWSMMLTLIAFFTAVGSFTAYSGYDLLTNNLSSETATAAASVDSTYLFPVFNTTAADAEYIAGTSIVGLGASGWTLSYDLTIAAGADLIVSGAITAPNENVVATNTLTVAECGKKMTLNAATEFATVLPAVTAGCEFEFWVKGAPSGASYTIDMAAGAGNEVIVGHVYNAAGVNGGDSLIAADRITLVDGVAVKGDHVKLWSDGTSWYALAFVSADGGATFTSAIQ